MGNSFRKLGCLLGVSFACIATGASAQTATYTTDLGVLAGPGDAGHGAQAFYGTDLGYTYDHDGALHILFGDTWSSELGTLIDPATPNDDASGTIACVDGDAAEASMPGVDLTGTSSAVTAIRYSHLSDFMKAPLAGFSNGSDQYALFYTGKPQGCRRNSDCGAGLRCDPGLGFFGEEYFEEAGFTGPCIDGQPGCLSDTMANWWGWPIRNTGFCIDETSSRYQNNDSGRLAAVAIRLHVGVRDQSDRNRWVSFEWLTNKFANVTAEVGEIGGQPKVLLWGRPGYAAVGSHGRRADLYFAYADMPSGNPSFDWDVHYYVGMSEGAPVFSSDSAQAAPVLTEEHDIVNQHAITYVEALGRWVMFFGGGMSTVLTPAFPICGAIELFTGPDCVDVERGNGAIRMRTAPAPWGPWSPEQDVLVGGDPELGPVEQYAPGGILRHPDCVGPGCAPHSTSVFYSPQEYGFLYGVNVIDRFTEPRAGGAVDVYWNVSTWDPYRVHLFKTRIEP